MVAVKRFPDEEAPNWNNCPGAVATLGRPVVFVALEAKENPLADVVLTAVVAA